MYEANQLGSVSHRESIALMNPKALTSHPISRGRAAIHSFYVYHLAQERNSDFAMVS